MCKRNSFGHLREMLGLDISRPNTMVAQAVNSKGEAAQL